MGLVDLWMFDDVFIVDTDSIVGIVVPFLVLLSLIPSSSFYYPPF